jgi:hypothetical protein
MKRQDRLTLPLRYLLLIGQRDQWTCYLCHEGYRPGPDYRWEIDHEESLARGGRNLVRNLRLTHHICNHEKATA